MAEETNQIVGSVIAAWDGWRGSSFAIVADFADAATYQAYDSDAQHSRLRAELAQLADQVARVQFEVADPL